MVRGIINQKDIDPIPKGVCLHCGRAITPKVDHSDCGKDTLQARMVEEYNYYKKAYNDLREKVEWISVEDKLPENEQEVLACVFFGNGPPFEKEQFVAQFFTSDRGGYWDIIGYDKILVSYWMPLQNPPEADLKSAVEE